jgi:hypothetical protein
MRLVISATSDDERALKVEAIGEQAEAIVSELE